jgi:phosphatidylinositol alpha-1,6-mannosyltransferase
MPVIVTSDFPPRRGGIERYMVSLAEALTPSGSVVLVAPQQPGAAAYDADLPYPVIRYARSPRTSVPEEIARIAAAVPRAHRLCSDRRTIASSWIRAGIACALLPKSVRGDLAIIAHGTEILSQRGGLKRTAMRWTFSRGDAVVANSSFTAGVLRDLGVDDPVVAYCGVRGPAIPPVRAPEPTILSVGRLIRRKGFDRVLEALPAVLERVPTLRYEVVGHGPDASFLRDRAKELGIADHVRFLGEVDDAGLARAYARAWCFVLPTRTIDGDVEGFGIVYLEAALASLPSIGSRGCGAEDAIEDGRSGILVQGDDSAQIAAALVLLLTDRDRMVSMGAYGRARALEQFSWESVAQRIMGSLPARSPSV